MNREIISAAATGAKICRGTIRGVENRLIRVQVEMDDDPQTELLCEVLRSDGSRLCYRTGDQVLLWWTANEELGVILGRIEEGNALDMDTPEELRLEAKKSLTLRVGEGSITIREDGKILIKGKDLVSQAKRRNRIRGGSVEIN
jgi:hypothetical protein